MASTVTLTSPQFVASRFPVATTSSRSQLRSSVVARAAVATPPASARGGKNLYEVLQVKETASVREIKAAYRTMAKRAHPDVAPIGSVDFLEIRQAYETLSDPQARARLHEPSKDTWSVRGAFTSNMVCSFKTTDGSWDLEPISAKPSKAGTGFYQKCRSDNCIHISRFSYLMQNPVFTSQRQAKSADVIWKTFQTAEADAEY